VDPQKVSAAAIVVIGDWDSQRERYEGSCDEGHEPGTSEYSHEMLAEKERQAKPVKEC
jgi:hypothetical protein